MRRAVRWICILFALTVQLRLFGALAMAADPQSPDHSAAGSIPPELSSHLSVTATSATTTHETRLAHPFEYLRAQRERAEEKDARRIEAQRSGLEVAQSSSAPCSAVGCFSNSSNEDEDCVSTGIDTVNGGCVGNTFRSTPLAPFQVICGQTWAVDTGNGFATDVDWYSTETVWQDSLTWCVTAEFDFDIEVWIYPCNGGYMITSASGSACDTVCVSTRTFSGYPFHIMIRPSASSAAIMDCNLGPWNYHVWLIKHCEFACPENAVPEGEGCSEDPSVDNFNGGCFSSPQVYSPITPGQPVCGQVSSKDYWRDTDWYKTAFPLNAGDIVSWRLTANFPHAIAIFDQRRGCVTREVAGALGDPCATTVVDWKVDSSGVYCFVVGTQGTDYGYPCTEGPWTYVATLELCTSGCVAGGTPEGEPCFEGADDYYNGGCNSPNSAMQPIALDETICGQTWLTADFRDTDWFVYNAFAGDVLNFSVRAAYPIQMGVVDLTNGCQFATLYPEVTTINRCVTVSVTYTAPVSGQVILFVAPNFNFGQTPLMACDDGPWEYEATLSGTSCFCQCAANPECDGVTDIFDVIRSINVAFRDAAAMVDPSPTCPWQETDVNCDGVTDIFDVTKIINVAFHNGVRAAEFCNPCP